MMENLKLGIFAVIRPEFYRAGSRLQLKVELVKKSRSKFTC